MEFSISVTFTLIFIASKQKFNLFKFIKKKKIFVKNISIEVIENLLAIVVCLKENKKIKKNSIDTYVKWFISQIVLSLLLQQCTFIDPSFIRAEAFYVSQDKKLRAFPYEWRSFDRRDDYFVI